ncbi:MAG: Ig-like domain-containing protein, partial [Bacilli bacterium]
MKKILFLFSFTILLILGTAGCGNKELESISIKTAKLIQINETQNVDIEYFPPDAKEEITWKSNDEKIAKIENGVITGISEGETTITATATSGKNSTIKVTIYRKAESITTDKSNIEIYSGDSATIIASISPENATYKEIVWDTSNSDVVTVINGVITALKAGSATITATTKDGLSAKSEIVVKEKPIEYSGYGDKIISGINIPTGVYKVLLNNNGSSNFIVKFHTETDSYGDLLANEIGKYSGQTLLRDGSTSKTNNGMLEIKSSGSWSVKIEPVSGIINKSISGSGDTVTGLFLGETKRNVATINCSSSSNFIVKIHDEYGNRHLLVNEIGSYNGQALFKTNLNVKY